MKSAYELAIERKGVQNVKKLTTEQKSRIAEIDKLYKSKIAESNISAENKMKKVVGNHEDIQQIKEDLAVELASINSKMEKEKNKIRENE